MMGLKLVSLAQGASGVQPATIALLAAMLDRGLVPVVPDQGSVGASGDLAPLAHMAAAMLGVGEMIVGGARMPAATALHSAGLQPAVLGPKEGLALLNGTQFSTAYALAGLFEAERCCGGSGLVTGALSRPTRRDGSATRHSRTRIQRPAPVTPGRSTVAAALRALLAGSAIRDSRIRLDDDRVQDPYCLRCQPQVMGAVLDLLRQAAPRPSRPRPTASPTTRWCSPTPLEVLSRAAISTRSPSPSPPT